VYQHPGCELDFPAEPAPTSVGAGLFTKSGWGGFIHQIGVGRVDQNPGCELEFPAEPASTLGGAGLFTKSGWGGFIHQI
ncbi:MAG: hypothetical protein P5697_26465, partial [Limnospira sp. PMC 1256.20]|uniref:hypothetical protein n=1 Tax=Limnospira sp. PMC 1256.20 TaxID=2981054 RepID=UPI0028E1065D